MNATTSQYQAHQADYRISFRERTTQTAPTGRRGTFQRKRGQGPQLFNGIHRRRRKKICW